jgi:hypothetical protein
MTDPLWRGKTTQQGAWNTYSFLTEEDGDLPALDCPPGTEVEVWPAGDRPTIDRNRVRAVVVSALVDVGEPFSRAQVNRIANSVMLLLHGEGDETEEDAT